MAEFLSYPSVNGLMPDFARMSVGIVSGIDGQGDPISVVPIATKGFRAISYKDRSNGELVMGNAQVPLGQTSGMMAPEVGSITMLLPEYQTLRYALSNQDTDVLGDLGSAVVPGLAQAGALPGWGAYTTMFSMMITYGGVANTGRPYLITDYLFGCRMTGSDNSHRMSGGALEVTFPFQPTLIVPGGQFPDDGSDWSELQRAAVVLQNAISF